MGYNNNKQFDLNNYETVKSRKVRLRNDYPDSMIMPLPLSDLNYAANYIMMGALIWKDKKEMAKIEPDRLSQMMMMAAQATPQNAGAILVSIAIASGADANGYSLSMAGGKGADKSAWVENAEESAVGRALDNMGYHSGSASQEEMQKVQHIQEVQQSRIQFENQINAMYGQLMNAGHNPNYLNQVVSQSVKAFTHLHELSVDELEKLLNALQAAGNQGAYQANQQQYSQQPPPNTAPGAPAPPPPVQAVR